MLAYRDIKLEYTCNNRCAHCVITNQRLVAREYRGNEDLTTEECRSEIYEAKARRFGAVVLTGGEPTVRSDLIGLVEYAKSLGLAVGLQSNGRRLSDSILAESLVSRIDYFTVALHGATELTHDTITGVAGSFRETVSGLKNIVRLGGKVCGKTVISTYNRRELKEILICFQMCGVTRVNMAFPHGLGRAGTDFERVIPYYRDIKESLVSSMEYARTAGIFLDFEAVLPCLFGHACDISYFADFRMANRRLEVKQLDSEAKDWNRTRKSIKRKWAGCTECRFDDICEGYLDRVYRNEGSI